MIHIFTLSWEGADRLEKLYPTLKNVCKNFDWIWHIKENGSKDNSVSIVSSWEDKHINLVKLDHNRHNYSEGMNYLFKEASPKDDDIVITLNNDVIFNDDSSLSKMLALLEDDNIGLVGAKLNYSETRKIQHCGVLFHPRNNLPYHFRAGCEEEDRDRVNRYFPVVTGAISLLRADTYKNVFTKNKSGNCGFNENYHWAFDDVDFCMRILHHLGKKILYCGETDISHEESSSLKKNPINRMFLNHNAKFFLENWKKEADPSLSEKYQNKEFNLYA